MENISYSYQFDSGEDAVRKNTSAYQNISADVITLTEALELWIEWAESAGYRFREGAPELLLVAIQGAHPEKYELMDDYVGGC